MAMTEFHDRDLAGADFRNVNLAGATLRSVDLSDAQIRGSELHDSEPGWPQIEKFPLKQCLRTVVNEEWEHRLCAERDLTLLEKEN